MKISFLNCKFPVFKGRREDRNTINQLKIDNDYALTANNQIRITNAIKNLGKESGEENVKFLLDVANNLKYATNIQNGKEPNNNWKPQLKEAAEKSLSISNPVVKEKYSKEFDRVFNSANPLTKDEKEILKSQNFILGKIDKSQLRGIKNPNIRAIERNLEYFITSSETPIKQKKYIMERLAYLMSDKYEINSQLSNKKSQVLAELINDLVVNTKESKFPNTKAINQKQFGMCAAISISRKMMSYEYKPDYVDTILSELDNTDSVMVYDKTAIGTGKKVPVKKAVVDYYDALKKGYRILDAATTNWMNIADMYDANSVSKYEYIPFDRDSFGVLNDSHFAKIIDDPELANKHNYYQSLLKANSEIERAKDAKIKSMKSEIKLRNNQERYLEDITKDNASITEYVKEILPGIKPEKAHEVTKQLLKLQKNTSSDIKKLRKNVQKYHYIPNEEDEMKSRKIKEFLTKIGGKKVNAQALEKYAPEMQTLVAESISTEKDFNPKDIGQITKARRLYEAAAAYRFQVATGLKNPDVLGDKMVELSIPDKETVLTETYSKFIDKINRTQDATYLEHFSKIFGVKNSEVPDKLKEVKSIVDDILTNKLDDVYFMLGMQDRKHALALEIADQIKMIKTGDRPSIEAAAHNLKIKADKNSILKIYDKFEKILSDNPTEKEYLEIFNKTGHKSQLESFIGNFDMVNDALNDTENEIYPKSITENFKRANSIKENANIDDLIQKLSDVADIFNPYTESIDAALNITTVTDKNNMILDSADLPHVVMKKMENKGQLISERELMALRDRFDAIDKLRSQDEFSSRQGKLSNPELKKLTEGEKITVKKIENSLNMMYSDTHKSLIKTRKEIEKPLEEHMRKLGVDMGKYWTSTEGVSGLYSEQQAKIIQQLTGKPYHVTMDKEKAFDTIKNTPHSGISSSSVFHNKMGWHAQYVAEISPAEKNGKDVLYHDNSWGASENENTWVDSEGLTRTDYSDVRGGENGYITNKKFRNGNYIDELMYKAGKITEVEGKRDVLGEKFPLVSDFIVEGEDGQAKRLAMSIKDNIFLPESGYLDEFSKILSGMTQSEIREGILRNKTASYNYRKALKSIENRLDSTPFSKGIESEEAYNALADDDPIKVAFEKTAFERSFPDGANWTKIAVAKNLSDIETLKAERNKTARSFFDYAFGKNEKILYAYGLDKGADNTYNIVNKALRAQGLNLSLNDEIKIIKETANYTKDEKALFDGNISHTIDFMVNKVLKQFDEVVPKSDKAELAKADIKKNLTEAMHKYLDFNIGDIDNTSTKFKAIEKYIDRKYNPATNEEFVEIYKKLQNMTTEEFNKVTSDVKLEDLGIKPYRGYEMLRRYKACDSKTEETFMNTVYQNEILKTLKFSDTTPSYKFHKLYMQKQGAFYVKGRTFDDLYRSFDVSLSSLNLEKLFNKHKEEGIRKYGVFPAYPKISVISENRLADGYEAINTIINSIVEEAQSCKASLDVYAITDRLSRNIMNISDNKIPTNTEYQAIVNLTSSFLTNNYGDSSIQKSLDSAGKILALSSESTGKDYKEAFSGMFEEINRIKKINTPESLKSSIKISYNQLKKTLDGVIADNIPKKYQSKLISDVNTWINESIKSYNSDFIINSLSMIEEKIGKYSNENKNVLREKNGFFSTLEAHLYSITNLKNVEGTDLATLDSSIKSEIMGIEKATKTFVKSNIKPAYQASVIASVDKLIKVANSSKTAEKHVNGADAAYSKFTEDYKNYNILKYPEEVLNEFMKLNAKDSNVRYELDKSIVGDEAIAKQIEQNLLSRKKTLCSLLDFAQLAEMQSLLMDAVETGNGAAIANNFKRFDIASLADVKTGLPSNMSDNGVIDYMVRMLTFDEDIDTSTMFVNKLGLTKKFLTAENEVMDKMNSKNTIKRMINIAKTTLLQKKIVKEEVDKLLADKDFDTCEDFGERINVAKQNIIKKGKNLSRQKSLKNYLTTLDNARQFLNTRKNIQRASVLESFIDKVAKTEEDAAKTAIGAEQSKIESINVIARIINKLNIVENSEEDALKTNFILKILDLNTFRDNYLEKVMKLNSKLEITKLLHL